MEPPKPVESWHEYIEREAEEQRREEAAEREAKVLGPRSAQTEDE